jgi:hypothetical protein
MAIKIADIRLLSSDFKGNLKRCRQARAILRGHAPAGARATFQSGAAVNGYGLSEPVLSIRVEY